jgi:hypothetical protein
MIARLIIAVVMATITMVVPNPSESMLLATNVKLTRKQRRKMKKI